MFFNVNVFSQVRLDPGTYTSSDGYYSIQVVIVPEGLQIIEPTKVNLYKLGSNGWYWHSDQKYSQYYIKIVNSKELRTGKEGAVESVFSWAGPLKEINLEDVELNKDCMMLAEKYQALAIDDVDTQAWTFCAAAAVVKCMGSEEDFENYAESIIISLKQIVVNKEKCPCEDVISAALWKKY